jgi:hypothetical protein
LAAKIRDLRDSWEFDPHFVLSVGDDLANNDEDNSDDPLNKLNKGNKKVKLIEELNHEIEILDKEQADLKENERLQSMSKLELLKEKFGMVDSWIESKNHK